MTLNILFLLTYTSSLIHLPLEAGPQGQTAGKEAEDAGEEVEVTLYHWIMLVLGRNPVLIEAPVGSTHVMCPHLGVATQVIWPEAFLRKLASPAVGSPSY